MDQASANHVVRLLKACDAEIFQEERGSPFKVMSEVNIHTGIHIFIYTKNNTAHLSMYYGSLIS